MLHRLLSTALVASLVTVAAIPTVAQAQSADGVFVPIAGADLKWSAITPPGFDPGMEIAAVHGDPSVEGGAYTLRLRFPDGYRFPAHFHPNPENITVVDGTFLLAMGEEADESRLQTYSPADYIFVEGEHPHFGGAIGETTIQLHGVGPFDIIVVGSPEDTRRQVSLIR